MKPRRGEDLNSLLTKRFGQLVVAELIWVEDNRGKRRRKALCLCDCGKSRCVNISELERGHTQSCGCKRSFVSTFKRAEDLKGLRFGKLVAVNHVGSHRKGGASWDCLCDCGKTCTVKATRLKDGMTKSCGCYQKCSGKEHWNWDNSITKEQREASKRGEIKDPQYDIWRKSVFERDNYRCTITGKTGKLEAHHLNAWNSHPDQRYDIDNGATLSKKIHRLFHKVYGRGNNTLEQFEEFKLCLTSFA